MGVTKIFTQSHTTIGTKDAIVVNGKARINLFGASTTGQSGNYFQPVMQMVPGGKWIPIPETSDASGGGTTVRDDAGATIGNSFTYQTPHAVYAVRLFIQRLAFSTLAMEVVVMEPTSIQAVAA